MAILNRRRRQPPPQPPPPVYQGLLGRPGCSDPASSRHCGDPALVRHAHHVPRSLRSGAPLLLSSFVGDKAQGLEATLAGDTGGCLPRASPGSKVRRRHLAVLMPGPLRSVPGASMAGSPMMVSRPPSEGTRSSPRIRSGEWPRRRPRAYSSRPSCPWGPMGAPRCAHRRPVPSVSGNHPRSEGLTGSQTRGCPVPSRQGQYRSTRCCRGSATAFAPWVTTTGSRASEAMSTPCRSGASRTTAWRAVAPGATCLAAPATPNPSPCPVSRRRGRGTSRPDAGGRRTPTQA